MDGTCPYGVVQRSPQHANNGSIDASHRSLHGITLTQKLPIRESSKNKKERWQENGYQQQNSTKPASQWRLHSSPQEGSKRKERSGYGLGCTITSQESIASNQAGRYYTCLKQWQNNMSASEYKGTYSVEFSEG